MIAAFRDVDDRILFDYEKRFLFPAASSSSHAVLSTGDSGFVYAFVPPSTVKFAPVM